MHAHYLIELESDSEYLSYLQASAPGKSVSEIKSTPITKLAYLLDKELSAGLSEVWQFKKWNQTLEIVEYLVDQVGDLSQLVQTEQGDMSLCALAIKSINTFLTKCYDPIVFRGVVIEKKPELQIQEKKAETRLLALIDKMTRKTSRLDAGAMHPVFAAVGVTQSISIEEYLKQDTLLVSTDVAKLFRNTIIQIFIHSGIDIATLRDKNGHTTVEWAAALGDVATFTMLVSPLLKKISIEEKNKLLAIVLRKLSHKAQSDISQSTGFVEIANLLIQHGADPNTMIGEPPLSIAIQTLTALQSAWIRDAFDSVEEKEREAVNHKINALVDALISHPKLDTRPDSIFAGIKTLIDLGTNPKNKVSVHPEVIHKALARQPALFSDPRYSIKLITSFLNSELYPELYTPYLRAVNLSGTSALDVIELFMAAVKKNNLNIINAIFAHEPLIFAHLSENQRLLLFKAALDEQNYSLAHEILSFPLDVNEALNFLFLPLANADKTHPEHIRNGFLNSLVAKGATPFNERSISKLITETYYDRKHKIDYSSSGADVVNQLLSEGHIDLVKTLFEKNREQNQIIMGKDIVKAMISPDGDKEPLHVQIMKYNELKEHGFLNPSFVAFFDKNLRESHIQMLRHVERHPEVIALLEYYADFPKYYLNELPDDIISKILSISLSSYLLLYR